MGHVITKDCVCLIYNYIPRVSLSLVQLFHDPMGCSPPGSSVHGVSQQEYKSGLPFPSPGDLPNSGTEPMSPALADGFFTPAPTGKPILRA